MKFAKYLVLLLLILVVIFSSIFSSAIRCLLIDFQDFNHQNKQLYFSSKSSISELKALQNSISLAQKRIANFWEHPQKNIPIIYCNDNSSYASFCQNSEGAGCSISTPFGNWIVINKDGLNTDVIAHEMCHIELYSSVGWWNSKTKTPAWFDEGLAMMLDYRFVAETDSLQRFEAYKNLLKSYRIDKFDLKNLEKASNFSTQSAFQNKIAYLQAGYTISKILAKKDKKYLFLMIEEIKSKGAI